MNKLNKPDGNDIKYQFNGNDIKYQFRIEG